jgi:hypothetical protein
MERIYEPDIDAKGLKTRCIDLLKLSAQGKIEDTAGLSYQIPGRFI